MQFDAGIFGGKLPVSLSLSGITLGLPGTDFAYQVLFSGNVPI